jgi:CelD/BcsL family acetyltransferase involved in cellulose biosynthesis
MNALGVRPVSLPEPAPVFRFVPPEGLTPAEIAAWRRFQASDPDLDSPYLTPEFVRLAAALRPDVTVAIAERDGQPMAFLPFERRGNVGRPVAGAVNDCQAVIAAPGWRWDPRALLRAGGLGVLDFTGLRASQTPLAPFHRAVVPSHIVDLSRGYAAYVEERRSAASLVKRAKQAERQVGPLRFTLHDPDPAMLRRALGWKSEQYRRSRIPDAFAWPWLVTLLERIQAMREPGFAGVLSTLHGGDRLIAAHMGMRSATTLHYWFPTYDTQAAKVSPGLLLFAAMCRDAALHGIVRIELGTGDEPYKLMLANAAIPVAQGFIGGLSLPALLRRGRHGVEAAMGRLPLGPVAAWPGRLFRRLDQIGRYR